MRVFGLLMVGVMMLVACASQESVQSSAIQQVALPRVERSDDDRYTFPPQVMTYAELAELLSTPQRQVKVHPNLRQRGVLIALKDRRWDDLRPLLEYGLEVQFVQQEDEDGIERWQIVRHPDAEKRDALLFNRYVHLAHDRLTTQLRQFDEWFGRPREALKQELEQMELGALGDFVNEADSWQEARIPAQAQRDWTRFLDGLWVQSLDGYVMLQWMRRNWNEPLTRQLIRERFIIIQQPLTSGFPGIISEADLRDFLKNVPESELIAYDWAIGVVSWSAELRMVFPYCDIVAPHREGTQWMAFPLSLRAEPLTWGELWQQLGKEAEAYLRELSARQESLKNEPALNKPFRAKGVDSLSQLLEAWATTHEREILMELAPERERIFPPPNANWVLSGLTQPNFSDWLGDEESFPENYSLALFYTLREPAIVDKTVYEVILSTLDTMVPRWFYESHEGVLVVRNPLAFLDRQYTYPLDALFALERAIPQAGDDPYRLIELLGAFAWSLIRQPDHAPALAEYRLGAKLGWFEKLPALAVLASLPEQEKRRLVQRLQSGQEVRLSLQQVSRERLDAFTRFWRRTAHYSSSQEPFGYRNAWHPRFTARLRQALLVIKPDEDGSWELSLEMSELLPNGETSMRARYFGALDFSSFQGNPEPNE